jgi:predicted dehydrogenase
MTTSYLDAPLGYKIRKVLRYMSLYGISRTMVKIRGQFHMRRDFKMYGDVWGNPSCRAAQHHDRFVAIIGCGNFGYSGIAYYLAKRSRRFLRATLDTNESRAISLCKDYSGAYATTNLDKILNDPSVRLVYIVSNHASHADYAIRCIEAGKHVHIEKPHVVTDDQLNRLLLAQRKHPESMVFLGFNRPKSEHFARIQGALQTQSGPIMINWFIAGHEIPQDHWYFKEAEGGRVLGNLCHWTDLSLAMIGVERAFPCVITPTSHPDAKSDFGIGIRFADGSVAGITFSVKGHLFEGVREVLQAHRGDTIVRLWDFEETLIETVHKRYRFKTRHRDHGHGTNIVDSYESVWRDLPGRAVSEATLAATSRLFLGVKQALDSGTSVTLDPDYTPAVDDTHQGFDRKISENVISMSATAPPYRTNK